MKDVRLLPLETFPDNLRLQRCFTQVFLYWGRSYTQWNVQIPSIHKIYPCHKKLINTEDISLITESSLMPPGQSLFPTDIYCFGFYHHRLVLPFPEHHINEIIQDIWFFIWLLSFNKMFLIFNHVIVYTSPLNDYSTIVYMLSCWQTFGLFPDFAYCKF